MPKTKRFLHILRYKNSAGRPLYATIDQDLVLTAQHNNTILNVTTELFRLPQKLTDTLAFSQTIHSVIISSRKKPNKHHAYGRSRNVYLHTTISPVLMHSKVSKTKELTRTVM